MRCKLSDLADVAIGTTLTRVSALEHDDAKKLETISMQEVSYFCNKSETQPEVLVSEINATKINNCIFTQENDVVIGLTSKNAMVIDYSRADKLLLSNFSRIRIHDTNFLYPRFLCWMLNEHNETRRSFTSKVQVTLGIQVITTQNIRDLDIEVLPYETQKLIGDLYVLDLKKIKIDRKIEENRKKILNYKINELMKEKK